MLTSSRDGSGCTAGTEQESHAEDTVSPTGGPGSIMIPARDCTKGTFPPDSTMRYACCVWRALWRCREDLRRLLEYNTVHKALLEYNTVHKATEMKLLRPRAIKPFGPWPTSMMRMAGHNGGSLLAYYTCKRIMPFVPFFGAADSLTGDGALVTAASCPRGLR